MNFLGDADSTGAVCGQIAGAFYGYISIPVKCVQLKDQWDHGDTELRAAMLVGCRLAEVTSRIDMLIMVGGQYFC